MSPAAFIQWLLRIIAQFFQQTPRRLYNESKTPPNDSIFLCDVCREPLSTIFRYDDKSYCGSCRADIDSDESDGDAFND